MPKLAVLHKYARKWGNFSTVKPVQAPWKVDGGLEHTKVKNGSDGPAFSDKSFAKFT